MPNELMNDRPLCILRVRKVVGDEIDAPIPQGSFRVPRGIEGKFTHTLLDDDPWYVLAAHKLLGIFLKLRNRKL